MLEQLKTQTKFTLMADGHTFNYLSASGFVFLVVADEAFGRQVPFACLDQIAAEFTRAHGDAAAGAIALADAFGRGSRSSWTRAPRTRTRRRPRSVQQQVSEVKEIMMDNIEKVLDRGRRSSSWWTRRKT